MLALDFDAMAERLRTLLESRQQLLRDVSHELRSPLARLQIALGLARRPGADLARELDRIERETQRLDELIGEIMSLCRLDDPARRLDLEPVALDELLDSLCESARMEADARGIRIDLRTAPGLMLRGDRELLHRAIENVVRNAIRFSPQGGLVSITATAAGDDLVIQIGDQGPGVPAELLGRIFEPFFRVGSARDRDGGGNGIGLAITSRVVGLHGGAASARNRDAGGLEVELRFPARA
jgi:signal transduction histidine kinase